MRLPHYLALSPSGVFHFRQRVPRQHRAALGREIRLSLRTREPRAAQLAAQALAGRYALAFRSGSGAVDAKRLIEEAEAALRGGGAMERYKISGPGFELEANNTREHRQIVEALREARATITARPATAQPLPVEAPGAAQKKSSPPALLRNVVGAYGENLRRVAMPEKTRRIKSNAVRSLAEVLDKRSAKPVALSDVSRADVAAWVDALRKQGNATPTVRNKASYVQGFFTWAMGQGLYPQGDNPAQGIVAYGTREKRHRRKEGFQVFTREQVAALFAPDAFQRLAPAARWGALLGLYTGARVSEIAQALLADFIEQSGFLCLCITDEGQGQSLKTESSARLVPLHPDLLVMGLPAQLAALRATGSRRFFGERGTVSKVNGAGSWLSKAWSYYLGKLAIAPDGAGRLGFHSLRKTMTQRLQDAQVPAEIRAALVGHDLDDVHHTHYARKPTIPEIAQALQTGFTPGLDLGALRLLLLESPESPPSA